MKKKIRKAAAGENLSGGEAAKAGKTTLQRQYIFIIAGLVLAALFALFYFLVYPLLVREAVGVSYTYDGEHYDAASETLYMIGPYERSDIDKMEVKNDNGIYVLNGKVNGLSKSYTLEGGENVTLDEISVAGIVFATGKPMAIAADSKSYRADEYATEEDLAKYGLDEASDPAWFRVTLSDGSTYRIFIGDVLPTGAGYYAYVEGRRNVVENEDGTTSEYHIVYVMDSSSSYSLMYGKTGLVSPIVGKYCGNGVSYLSNFEIQRYVENERKLIVQIVANENTETSTGSAFKMEYPRGYVLNDDEFERTVLSALSYIEATSVMAIGDEIYDTEVYEKYGLDLDKERLEAGTDKNHIKLTYKCLDDDSNDYENTLYISEKQLLADGTECYYAYSPSQDAIAMISAETIDFVSWSASSFTSARLFFEAIGSLDYFSILSADGKTDVRFTLKGNSYNYHVDVTDAAGENIIKDKDGNALVFDVEYERTKYETNYYGTFENFRDLYYVLITRMIDTNEEVVKIDESINPVYHLDAQVIMRDRSAQYYKYDGNTRVVEDGSYITVMYAGGNVLVSNLEGYIGDTKVAFDKAYYDEESGKYFVKAEDTADGEYKPRNYNYTDDNMLVPVYLNISNATAEYKVTTYEYDFYDLYDEVVGADGTVTKVINQTYMLVVPNSVERTYRIEADGSRTLISEDRVESDELFGSYIRRASVEKLINDTAKVIAGESIDKWGVD